MQMLQVEVIKTVLCLKFSLQNVKKKVLYSQIFEHARTNFSRMLV